MSTTTTNDIPETAAAAVTEATRIAAQAARRSTETARASVEAARTNFDDAAAFGRDLFGTWTAQSEAAMKAAFEAQNAAVATGMSYFDLSVTSNRQAIEKLTELIRQAQQATLDSWQSTVKAVTKAVELPTR